MEDLEEVRYLEMKVDTSDTSLGNFGVSVPNMVQLKLSDSLISSIRLVIAECIGTIAVICLSSIKLVYPQLNWFILEELN